MYKPTAIFMLSLPSLFLAACASDLNDSFGLRLRHSVPSMWSRGPEPAVDLSNPVTWIGEEVGDSFGSIVTRAGDINGDGYDDVMIAAPGWGDGRGAVYLYLGSGAGVATSAEIRLEGSADGTIGTAITRAGDINGDGYDDIAVAVAGEYPSIQLYYGGATGLGSTPDSRYLYIQAAEVSGGGDINGDGYDDVAVGFNGWWEITPGTIGACVYYGSAEGLAEDCSSGLTTDYAGWRVALVGDTNGDGYEDMSVGIEYNNETRIYLGAEGGLDTSTYTSLLTGGYLPQRVGDINGDGFFDIVTSTSLAATFYPGRPEGIQVADADPLPYDFIGQVHEGGDLNADGYGDLLISEASLIWYPDETFVVLGSASGPSSYDSAGHLGTPGLGWLDGAGDTNGDGYDDMVYGVPVSNSYQGAAYLYYGQEPVHADWDDDGYDSTVDCNDYDLTIYPGAPELCDGVDTDCDGELDNGATNAQWLYADQDGDGAGGLTAALVCPGFGYTDTYTDCNDVDPSVYPGASEADDTIDNDCDGWVDEDYVSMGDILISEVNRQPRFGGASIVNAGQWFELYNASTRTIDLSNWVIAREYGTSNRQFAIDPTASLTLAPGSYAVLCATDNYEGSPAAWSLSCDYIWNDESQPSTYSSAYKDNRFVLLRDQDTLSIILNGDRTTGTRINQVTWTYNATAGYWPRDARFSMSVDPAYLTSSVNSLREVWCSTTASSSNAVSNNTSYRWYDTPATNNDEFGTPGYANYNCPNDPDIDGDGYTGATDCDDINSAIHPGMEEVCDGLDNNCDGVVDENGADIYYADADGDGAGDPLSIVESCGPVAGYVTTADDCDDTNWMISPYMTESCNSVDDNCNGLVDDNAVDALYFYPDTDGDGYGDMSQATLLCAQIEGYISDASDCDDSDAAIHPAAPEVCNGLDDNCSWEADEGALRDIPWYADQDGDGYGDATLPDSTCRQPWGYVDNDTDCNDADPSVQVSMWLYVDADLDGYGAGSGGMYCPSAGYEVINTDCDDTDPTTYPAGPELDDLGDNDCDGYVDEDYIQAGDVIISEINRQPRFGTSTTVRAGQWFEVYNASSRTIDFANWVFARGTSTIRSFAIDPAADFTLLPGDYGVLCFTDNYQDAAVAYPLYCDYIWGDETQASNWQGTYHTNAFELLRDSDRLSIYVNGSVMTGTQVDQVTWSYNSTSGYWPRNARFSMSLDPDYLNGETNSLIGAWCSTTATSSGTISNNSSYRWYDTPATSNDEYGTPGAANYDCSTDLNGDGYRWVYQRIDDCTGFDIQASGGSSIPVDTECSASMDGKTAVCWDGVTYTHPGGVWCTYKDISASDCQYGAVPGYLYVCSNTP